MKLAPCHAAGEAMNPCAKLVWALHAEQHVDLTGKWAGWKLRGRELITPHGDRITPQRLAALVYLEGLSKASGQGANVTGVVVPIRAARKTVTA